MRSRAARLSCAAIAFIALGAAAVFVGSSEQQLTLLRADGRAFDLRAREVTAALSDLRAAQQAYVAAGQGVAFWMPKVAETADGVGAAVASLGAEATSTAAQSAITETISTLAEFRDVDTRARDYLRAGELLMAADVIFTEGDRTAAAAARFVESARLAEHQSLDAAEGVVRRQQAFTLAGAGGLTASILLLLGLTRTSPTAARAAVSTPAPLSITPERSTAAAQSGESAASIRAVSPVLKTAAQLCTDFARVRNLSDLELLLARASDVMDAAGVVVWLGNGDKGELQPVLSHGYSEELRARLPNVPRTANNAAAAAYRSGNVQIVLSRPGGRTGAVVAPILGVQGCIGALSAEIRGGGEASDSVQALASIVAAQLAGVLGATQPAAPAARAAASS